MSSFAILSRLILNRCFTILHSRQRRGAPWSRNARRVFTLFKVHHHWLHCRPEKSFTFAILARAHNKTSACSPASINTCEFLTLFLNVQHGQHHFPEIFCQLSPSFLTNNTEILDRLVVQWTGHQIKMVIYWTLDGHLAVAVRRQRMFHRQQQNTCWFSAAGFNSLS